MKQQYRDSVIIIASCFGEILCQMNKQAQTSCLTHKRRRSHSEKLLNTPIKVLYNSSLQVGDTS